MDFNFLAKTEIFKGLTENEIATSLKAVHAKKKTYTIGEVILTASAVSKTFGILEEGFAYIQTYDYNGNRCILNPVYKGDVFAETFAITGNKPNYLEVRAQAPCKVILIDAINSSAANMPWNPIITQNIIKITADKAISFARRNFINAQRRTREKILMFLAVQSAKYNNSKDIYIDFDRQGLADYLLVDRSALSAELSNMQKDGLIKYKKNHFKLLYLDNFS